MLDRRRGLFLSNIFETVLQKKEEILSQVDLQDKNKEEKISLIADHYIDKMYRYVQYTFNLTGMDTEDIIQDMLLRVYAKLDTFDHEKKIEPWLFRVAHNSCINWLKKHRDIVQPTTLGEEKFIQNLQTQNPQSLTQEIEWTYKNALLKVLLMKLKIKNRELITLYYFENKTYDEIATVT